MEFSNDLSASPGHFSNVFLSISTPWAEIWFTENCHMNSQELQIARRRDEGGRCNSFRKAFRE
jgi:hypothetical protein